jgi:hypothetical protein
MRLTVKFEDADHVYEIDFNKVLERLNVPIEDVKLVIDEMIRKS